MMHKHSCFCDCPPCRLADDMLRFRVGVTIFVLFLVAAVLLLVPRPAHAQMLSKTLAVADAANIASLGVLGAGVTRLGWQVDHTSGVFFGGIAVPSVWQMGHQLHKVNRAAIKDGSKWDKVELIIGNALAAYGNFQLGRVLMRSSKRVSR